MKLEGWTYLKEFGTGDIVRKPDRRTKLYALAAGSILVYQLPPDTNLDALEFVTDGARAVLSDGSGLQMDLSEHFGAR